ncbi:class I SAM-dependent methyltransferase, partial [Dankookia rubra]
MRADLSPREAVAGHDALAPLLDPAIGPLFRQPLPGEADSAWHGHVPFAFWLVEAIRPRSIVELGAHRGVSYLAFCQAVEEAGIEARCMAVDTWQGDPQAGFYGDEALETLRAFHDPRYGHFSKLRRATFAAALDAVADGSVDLLHIDGFHGHEAVRADFTGWLPKLSGRGVVILHGTNEHRPGFGVRRFMQELREAYPAFEFLHAHGLGLVTVGSDPPAAAAALCRLRDPGQVALVRDRFAALGAIQERLALAEASAAAAAARIAEVQAAALGAVQDALASRDAAADRAAAIEASLAWRLSGPARR